MTEKRDFDRMTRAWLDLMPDQAPDRSIAAVLQTIERMPQKRPPRLVLRRFQPVNRFSYAAIAAVLAVVLVGGGYLLTRSTLPSVGNSPSPSLTPSASPAAPASLPPTVPAAQTLWGDWVADPGPIAGLPAQGTRIQLSINWDGGKTAWVQTNYVDGTQALNSNSIAHAPDQLALVSTLASGGCAKGDIGTYRFVRSPDGLFLTLTPVSDGCAFRSTVLARTWVHTLSAVTDGGHGVLPVDNLELTLPNRRFGLGGLAGGPQDSTADGGPLIEFLAIKDPVPFKVPCAASLETAAPLTSSVNLVAYVKALPQFTFKSASSTIDGHPATHLTGTPRSGYTCASGDVGLFYGTDQSWTTSPGNTQPLSVWITQVGSDAWLFWYRGDQITPADEVPVISSIKFITQLPTP
jgi:hypothetical protein